MKRSNFILSSLILFSLVFTGCTSEESAPEPLTQNYENIEGEFKSLGGIKVDKSITHLFEDNDGEVYYAFSSRYDLGEADYFNTPVAAYGLVMNYEENVFDKPIFEVRRITELEIEELEEVEIEVLEFKDTQLGIQIEYPSSLELLGLRDAVELTFPLDSEEEGAMADSIVISNLGEVLETTSDDEQGDRAEEIQNYVQLNQVGFSSLDAGLSYIGQDQQFAVRYSTAEGGSSYFVPRNQELFEITFLNQNEEDGLSNTNVFAEIVSSFRFLAYGDEDAEEGEANEGEESEDEAEAAENDSSSAEEDQEDEANEDDLGIDFSPSAPQVEVSSYREFESAPYDFKMSYPGSWYYSGGGMGYDFSDEPIDEESEVLIRLDLNTSYSDGLASSGDEVMITMTLDERNYTLTGDASYQSVMQAMIDSIEIVSDEN